MITSFDESVQVIMIDPAFLLLLLYVYLLG